MSTGPIEIDPESTTFTIKGVAGLVFYIEDLQLKYDPEWIDVYWDQPPVLGHTNYTVTIEAKRV